MDNSINNLAEMFKKFPGIGERQAKRFVYFLLRQKTDYVQKLSNEIKDVQKNVHICQESYQYFYSLESKILSPIAQDETRDKTKLLVIEKDADLETIEKTKIYNGNYFVLGGTLPHLHQEASSHIRAKELKAIIEMKIKRDGLDEIILALSVTPEGLHTENYIKELLAETINKNNLKISTLGRGLSTGLELEYSDKETLESAFEARK